MKRPATQWVKLGLVDTGVDGNRVFGGLPPPCP